MAVDERYLTLTRLKNARRAQNDTNDDLLGVALDAAHADVDDWTHRRFDKDAVASAREFRVAGRVLDDPDGELLLIDDIADTTGLVVETSSDGVTYTVLDTTKYRAGPVNALVKDRPVTELRRLSGGCWSGYVWVRVTAIWGWPAVPKQVTQATLLQANRFYLRKDSPEGVAGSAEWGVMRVVRVDPDVEKLLARFVLPEGDDD
jgi:hypothetical protein